MERLVTEKLLIFEQSLNQLIDEMLQDVYTASDDANKALYQNMEQRLATFWEQLKIEKEEQEQYLKNLYGNLQSSTAENPPCSMSANIPSSMSTTGQKPRFKVHLDPNFRRSPNPFDSTTSLPDLT